MALYRLKEGYGTHRKKINGVVKKLKPGDEVELTSQEVLSFGDKFELVGPPPPEPEEQKPILGLKLQHRGGGRYNVFNEATKEFINDKLLTRKEAESLISDLAEAEQGNKPKEESVLGKLFSKFSKQDEDKEEVDVEGENDEQEPEQEETSPSKVEGTENLARKDRISHRRGARTTKGKSKPNKK